MKYKIKCDWCGGEVKNASKHINRNKHFFCSMACYLSYKTKKVAVRCDWCRKEYMKKASDIKRTNHNFCSAQCSCDFHRWTGKTTRSPKVDGVPIHRLVAEKSLGRKIAENEEVHHLDFNHENNDPNNLIVITKSEHSKIHAAKKERDKNGRFIKTATDA